MTTPFTKMEGLGNDFVVVDRRAAGAPVSAMDATAWCDRRFGVGADGVLSVLPSRAAPLAMHVTNPDGSVAEMCGNGLRCVARWAIDRGLLPSEGGPVETGRGVLMCAAQRNGDIRIAMGAPRLEAASVPVLIDGSAQAFVLEASGARLAFTALSMGNPHAVHFAGAEDDVEAMAVRLGPCFERHPAFPNRANVSFVAQLGPAHFRAVVWERGAGRTLACGTGACAVAVAAQLTGRCTRGEAVRVELPGGALLIEPATDLREVWMSGPAREVFSGTLPA